MAAARPFLFRLKNALSNSARLFSSSAALIQQRPWTQFSDDSDGESAVYKKALKLQRPSTVEYQDCFLNYVSLIGVIDHPFKVCNSPKFGVHTVIRVNSPTGACPNFRVMLKFWNEMAEISVQHLKLNDLVYVSGQLASYMNVIGNGKSLRFYEVVVKEVNFVSQNSLGTANQNLVKFGPELSYEEIKQKHRDHLHLWQIFFASPYEWWDNRTRKRNPKAPDFKHKDTGEVLWLKDDDPRWVHKQLQLHDSRLYRRNPGEHKNAWSHLSPLVYE